MSNDNFSVDSVSQNYIFDLAPFPMWIYDLETLHFLAVNQEAIRHYGFSEREFLNMTIKDIRPIEDVPKVEKAVKDVRVRKDRFKQSLYKHQTKDKRIIYVQIKGNLINFNNKRAEIITAIDLTDRYNQAKRVEKQRLYLEANGELNEILLKSDFWSNSLEECFKIVSKCLIVDRVFFYENNIDKKTTSHRFSWESKNATSKFNSAEKQNIPWAKFPLFTLPLYQGKPFEANISNLPNSPTKNRLKTQNVKSILVLPVEINNNFSGFIGIEDCTRERNWEENDFQLLKTLNSNLAHLIMKEQAQEKLISSEARFKSLVQNGADLIAIINPLGDFTYVAPTTIKVLGTPPEKFIGKNAFDFIHYQDAKALQEYLKKILTTKFISSKPYRFEDAQGNWRWIQTDFTNHLSDPAIKGIVANTRDVTERVEKQISKKLLISISKIINKPGSLTFCLSQALNQLVKLYKICICEVWLISEDDTRIDLIANSSKGDKFKGFIHSSKIINHFEKGIGLPGQVWKNQHTIIWDKLSQDNRFKRSKAADSFNLKTAIGVPIIFNEKILGCLVCLCQAEMIELLEQVKLLKEVGLQIGVLIKQKNTIEQYQNFLNISPDPHCIIGFDGLLKKYNKAFRKLLGYNTTELLNVPIFRFIHSEDRDLAETTFKDSIKGENTDAIQARFITKSGKVKWLVWNRSVYPESKIIMAVAKDITEEKEAQKQLKITYERLKTAHKIAKIGYWVRDFDSEISEWSEETYKIYGYTPDNFEPTMQNVTKTFHPEDRYLIESNPLSMLEPGKIESFEHRIITAQNEIKWVHQEIRLLVDNKNNPLRVEGTIQDITEKKEIEIQIKISNERFQLATQASNEMIWDIDHTTNTINRSKSYEKTFKYTTKDLFSKDNSWNQNIHPQDADIVWNSLHQILNNKKENYWYSEYRIYTEDGSLAFLVDRCYIVRNENGDPIRSVGAALDVTTSRKQIKKIKKQNKKLREIAWVQSHIVRAPLSSIMGLIDLIKQTDKNEKSFEEIIDMILTAAEELDKVIHDIVDRTEKLQSENN
ncbi:PAS domain S-box protein [Salegentibacter agarivorans]|uniref:histidine kinase n=1 Tax=Salegentibacter agarivorans TaxID=345907 RepID=A0A1I2NBQ1_9FLAO|nr:PAS domain S-box protein [Salegentibacter agarivorans]SFG00938.1 PAS domain S-box-containing protein [Salegentibacter agarivorans]